MKVGIYLSGLGETFTHETAERYAKRFARQWDFFNADEAATYEIYTDKFEYDKQHQLVCNRISIIETSNGISKVVYKIYEYSYAAILTKKFKSKNALSKSWLLFLGVCGKLPSMLWNMVGHKGASSYDARFRREALYLFLLFFIVSLGIIILLPSALTVLVSIVVQDEWLTKWVAKQAVGIKSIHNILRLITNLTALLILLMPGFNDSIISLACEFVSASNYLEKGSTKQTIHGQMDMLLEQIVKTEGVDCEVYIHSYSFGTLISLDYLFPFGTEPSERMKRHFKGLITIGNPFDFISIYFPQFFKGRNLKLKDSVNWINVYSLSDALASNFRCRHDCGEAEYSFDEEAPRPINIEYEVANVDMNIVSQFFTLYSLRAHGNYWDKDDDGQSCLRLIIPEMKNRLML